MSGIVGIVHLDGEPVTASRLALMTDALALYGPDACNHLVRGPLGIAHLQRRITPEDAFDCQPIIDDGIVVVADARVDNREELASLLNIESFSLKKLPDSALVLAAYRRWGRKCVDYLLGDFAFAIWDPHHQHLFCARDHIGTAPFFYFVSDGLFAFASGAKGLLSLPDVPRHLNETKVADFLVQLHGDLEATFYKGIKRLPPGHTLQAPLNGREITLERYWSPDPSRSLILGSDEEYVEGFREVFERAVKCRLRTDGPMGVFLSGGGLDSSSIACTAARMLAKTGERLATFTAVPPVGFQGKEPENGYNDERSFVTAIAELHENITPHLVTSENEQLLGGLDQLYELNDAPMRHPVNRLWLEGIQGLAQSLGIRTLLHGWMGNMSISYNGVWLPPVWRSFHHGPTWLEESSIHPQFAREVNVEDRFERYGRIASKKMPSDGRLYRIHSMTRGMGTDMYDLYAAWKARFGVEKRDPTADIRVIEYCLAIPEDQYLRDQQNRYLIRRAMKGVVPSVVLNNVRAGAQTPDWYQRIRSESAAIRHEIDQLEKCEPAARMLDLREMRRLIEEWPRGGWTEDTTIRKYRFKLMRGIMVGRFLRWFVEHS